MSMKRVVMSLVLAVLAGLAQASESPAGAQAGGQLSGRITAAESGQPLRGAVVRVNGMSLSAISDAAGRFSLRGVPGGEWEVTATYVGRESGTAQVDVRAGGVAEALIPLSIEPVLIDAVTVVGSRAMTQAEALNRQKAAANIVNVVASDQMNRFPDASAPDAIQRIPGVAITRDQGEGRYIQIRGGSAANTQVTLNGVQVPSPEGEDRQVALDAVPVDLLEAIEVSKALLPSMDAEAIGGSVNLVTRRAPSGRLLSMEAAGGFSPIRGEPSASAAATYGTRSADDRLGFLVTGSYNRRDFGSDDLEPIYDLGDAGLGDDALEEMEVRHYSLYRRRLGATGSMDYAAGPNSLLRLTGVFSRLQDHEQRRTLLHAIEDGELAFLHKNRLEELDTYSASLDGDHVIGGGLRVSHKLSYARSLEHTPFDNEIEFVQEGVTFAPDIRDPDRITSNPAAGAIDGAYEFAGIEMGRSDTRNSDWTASVDFASPFLSGPRLGAEITFGFSVRQKNKMREVTEEVAELVNGAGSILLGQQVGGRWGERIQSPGVYPHPSFGTSPADVRGFPSRFGSALETEIDIEADTNDYEIDERIAAGYVMASIDLTPKLMLLPGIRYEHTRFAGDGHSFDTDTEELTATSGSRSYGNLFPTVHLKYTPGENTNVRAAFTSSIARPGFFHLVPYRLRDDEDLALGNPSLKPTTARNFDLMLEHFNRRIGVISLGAFHKRLADPIFVFIEDNDLGGETEQPRNGDSGEITGVEVAIQQRLSGLPAPFDGLGVYANYTYTDSRSTLPSGRTVALQGQPDHVMNAALSYERARFWGQVSANFHDSYVAEYGEEDFEDVFADRQLRFDASFSARVTQSGSLFLELVNLTNEPYVAYQGDRSRPIQMEYYERWGRLGYRMAL